MSDFRFKRPAGRIADAVRHGQKAPLAGIHVVFFMGIEGEDDLRIFRFGLLNACGDSGNDGAGLLAAQRAGDEIALHIDDDKKIGHEKIPPEIRHLIEWENEGNNRLCGRQAALRSLTRGCVCFATRGRRAAARTCLRDFIPQTPFLASRRHKQNNFDNEGANSCICFGLRRNRIYATLIGTKNERGRKQAHRLA